MSDFKELTLSITLGCVSAYAFIKVTETITESIRRKYSASAHMTDRLERLEDIIVRGAEQAQAQKRMNE